MLVDTSRAGAPPGPSFVSATLRRTDCTTATVTVTSRLLEESKYKIEEQNKAKQSKTEQEIEECAGGKRNGGRKPAPHSADNSARTIARPDLSRNSRGGRRETGCSCSCNSIGN